jgi:hypothetical protein
MTPIRIRVVTIALSIAFGSLGGRLDAPLSERPERVRHGLFSQTDGGWQGVDDRQSERQRVTILLLRRCRATLPSIRPLVHVGVGAAGVPVARSGLALTD